MKQRRYLIAPIVAMLCVASTCSVVLPVQAASKDKDVIPKGATPREISMGDKDEKELEKSPED